MFDMTFYKGKRVLITGHTGFKGSWLCEVLVKYGAYVIGYSLQPPTEPSLYRLAGIEKEIVSVIGDIRDFKKLYSVFEKYNPEIVVVDPVMISKSGYSLLRPEAKENLIKYLIPMAYLVTPNVPEAEEITGMKIETVEDMKKAGKKILDLGPKYVLVKGGHLDGDAVDVLMGEDTFEVFTSERLDRKNTHGTGCTLSSAITSHIALGYDVVEAVRRSKEYITEAIRHSFDIGHGVGPVNHFYEFEGIE